MNEVPSWLEWERLRTPLSFTVTDPGDLLQDPGDTLRVGVVTRTNELMISLRCEGTGRAVIPLRSNTALRAGELLLASRDIHGVNRSERITLRGVRELGRSGSRNFEGQTSVSQLVVESQCSEVEIRLSEKTASWIVEWCVNASFLFAFSRRTHRRWRNEFFRDRGEVSEVHLKSGADSGSDSFDHFGLNITLGGRNITLLVGVPPDEVCPVEQGAAFIQYSWGEAAGHAPNDEERHLTRDALSFALGCQLNIVGSTWFDTQWQPIRATSVPAHFLGRASGFGAPSKPPVSLFRAGSRVIDEALLAAVVSGFITLSMKLDVRASLWFLWLGQASPLEAAPAHLGAALESLRDAYTSMPRTIHVPSETWRPVVAQLEAAFEQAVQGMDQGLQKELYKIGKKLQQLNARSSAYKYEDFFLELALDVGGVETNALQERNKPAH